MGRVWELLKQAIFTILGGYVGAIFGVVAIGKMAMNVAFFLTIVYSLMIIGLILLGDITIDRKEKNQTIP